MINWKTCNPLSTEDLNITARKAKQGDPKAIELLISSNVKLASTIAYQYSDFNGTNVQDLTSEALLGLIESIPLFDPDRGTKFTTFASWRMRMHVLNSVLDNFRMVKIGTTQAQRKIFWRLNRETAAICQEGIDPTEQVLAERLEVKVKEICEMRIRMNNTESSLDAGDPCSETGSSLFDSTPSDEPTPEQYVTHKRMVSWMQAKMIEFEQRLTGNDLAVWNYRIASEEPKTMDSIGVMLGRTRQRVEQIDRKLRIDFEKYVKKQDKV